MSKTTPFIEAMKKHILFKKNYKKIKSNIKQNVLLLSHLLHYVSHHEKVFICRFDLHFPLEMWNENNEKVPIPQKMKAKYSFPENRHKRVINTMQNFRRKLERTKQNELHPWFLHAIEKSSDRENLEYEHLHILVLLNGNRTQKIQNHWKALEKIWYKQLEFDYNRNKGLVQLPKKNNDQFYNGTMLCRNSSTFLDEFIDVFRFSSYLIKKEQKDNVPFRKKVNTSQLKLEEYEKEIKKFTLDLIQSCLKGDTESFYEKYITKPFFSKILLWGSKPDNQVQTTCSLNDNTTDTSDYSDSLETSDNEVQAEENAADTESKEVETINSSAVPQNRRVKAPQKEVNFYTIFDSNFENKESTTCNFVNDPTEISNRNDGLDLFDEEETFEDNPFETETKEFETISTSIAPQDVCIKANHENAHYSKQEEIYNEDEINEETRVTYLHEIENYKKSLIKENEEYLKDPEEEEENDEYPEIIPCEDCCV